MESKKRRVLKNEYNVLLLGLNYMGKSSLFDEYQYMNEMEEDVASFYVEAPSKKFKIKLMVKNKIIKNKQIKNILGQ